jgi:hypothetical protein
LQEQRLQTPQTGLFQQESIKFGLAQREVVVEHLALTQHQKHPAEAAVEAVGDFLYFQLMRVR